MAIMGFEFFQDGTHTTLGKTSQPLLESFHPQKVLSYIKWNLPLCDFDPLPSFTIILQSRPAASPDSNIQTYKEGSPLLPLTPTSLYISCLIISISTTYWTD